MKDKYILPLSMVIISRLFFFQWHFLDVDDAPRTVFYGFPYPYIANGWHTSMSLQIYFKPLIINTTITYIIIYSLISTWNKYLWRIRINRFFKNVLYLISILILYFHFIMYSLDENLYYWDIDFNYKVLAKGLGHCFSNVQEFRQE